MNTQSPSSELPRAPETAEMDAAGASLYRSIPAGWRGVSYATCILMSLFHIWVNSFGVMPGIYRNAVHLGFVLMLIFMSPLSKTHPRRYMPVEAVLVLLSALVALYILLFEEQLHLERASIPIMRDYVFAVLAVALLLYATYRAVGWFIPALAMLFLFYALYLGSHIPGMFHYRGVALTRLLYRMYLTDEGIFGIVCTVSSTYVILFILFGAFLLKSGAGDFIIRLSQAVAGHWVGGPAKIAVVASGFMGSVSGSAVANTVATGSLTIPLMKKVGYRPPVCGRGRGRRLHRGAAHASHHGCRRLHHGPVDGDFLHQDHRGGHDSRHHVFRLGCLLRPCGGAQARHQADAQE